MADSSLPPLKQGVADILGPGWSAFYERLDEESLYNPKLKHLVKRAKDTIGDVIKKGGMDREVADGIRQTLKWYEGKAYQASSWEYKPEFQEFNKGLEALDKISRGRNKDGAKDDSMTAAMQDEAKRILTELKTDGHDADRHYQDLVDAGKQSNPYDDVQKAIESRPSYKQAKEAEDKKNEQKKDEIGLKNAQNLLDKMRKEGGENNSDRRAAHSLWINLKSGQLKKDQIIELTDAGNAGSDEKVKRKIKKTAVFKEMRKVQAQHDDQKKREDNIDAALEYLKKFRFTPENGISRTLASTLNDERAWVVSHKSELNDPQKDALAELGQKIMGGAKPTGRVIRGMFIRHFRNHGMLPAQSQRGFQNGNPFFNRYGANPLAYYGAIQNALVNNALYYQALQRNSLVFDPFNRLQNNFAGAQGLPLLPQGF